MLSDVFRLSAFVFFLLASFGLRPWPAYAAPSKLLSYQGRVTDANGQPIADGTYTLRFKIYSTLADCNADGAPNLIWGPETHDGGAGNPAQVQVTNGLFSAVLGTDVDTPLNSSFDADYWLQVKVGANPVFTPCDRLTTSPYAINAINADSCNTDATCETAALSTTGDATIGGRIDVNATGSSFLGRIGIEGNTGIACNPGTGSSGIWYADAGDCNTVFVGINTATNGAEKWGIWLGNWDWTIDVNGNVWQGGNLSLDNTKYIEFAGNTLGADSSRLYTSGTSNRLFVRAEDTDNVAQFASYGLYLPLDPGVSLYVGGDVRIGYASGADNDAIQFDDGTKTLTWNDATGRFDFNADVTAPTFVGALTGTATNANNCSALATCTVQQIDSGPGSTEVHLMNQNIRTSDNVTFGTVTATGEVLAPAFRAPSAGYSSGAALDVGDVAVDYPGNAGWPATWNSNILLSGLNSSSISFHDAGLRVDTLRAAGGTFYLGENVGWGVANLNVGGSVTTPGYVSITGASDGAGNLRFSAANPYIVASSYFVAPGGAYFNSGTVYTEAAIQARGGINDDGASAKLDLIDPDGVNITAGPLFMAGTPFCTMVDIPDVSSGTRDTQCPVGWKVVAYYARGTGYYCGGAVSHNAGWTDGYVRGYCNTHSGNCVGANLNAGDNCFYGNMLCCWAS